MCNAGRPGRFLLGLDRESAVREYMGGAGIDQQGARIARKSAQVVDVRKMRFEIRSRPGDGQCVAKPFQSAGRNVSA